MITAYHHPEFAAPIGDHVMPMRKFALVAKGLESMAGVRVEEPFPATPVELARVHTQTYIDAVRTGTPRALAESQKFPWSPALFPSVCLTNGACICAARRALRDGVSCAVASGFHHAHADHGEGFCTFNGLIVAAEAMLKEGGAKRVAILDLDLHYGNGTASLAAVRPWITALSIYGNDYHENVAYRDVSVSRHQDGANRFSATLPAGCDGKELLQTLEQNLPNLLKLGIPELILYQAGADPLRDDPYSPLDLGHEDLRERDRKVFAFARERGIPIAWVLAGGYARDVEKIVAVHLNTFEAARMVF